ncbi:MAG TPA: hypothetical protein VNM37_10325 [Candidatus Dormibacteraeota bacterium]|nr:hypothetical protein [Candidatus Dormibacteraeota bacterium]
MNKGEEMECLPEPTPDMTPKSASVGAEPAAARQHASGAIMADGCWSCGHYGNHGGNANGTAKRLAMHIQSAIEDWVTDQNRCECGDLILPGHRVIRSADCGFLHYECVGDDGFVDENDEPLAPDAPRPEGFVWSEEDAKP